MQPCKRPSPFFKKKKEKKNKALALQYSHKSENFENDAIPGKLCSAKQR
jgi:hypothetical protein